MFSLGSALLKVRNGSSSLLGGQYTARVASGSVANSQGSAQKVDELW